MDQYVGLDVSLKETSIAVRQNRKRIWRGKCPSHPKAVAEAIRKHTARAALVVFETGSLATWFYRELAAEGLPAVRIDARHAKAALATAPNKTDANDADGLALLAEAGFFREVRVKSWQAMRVRALIGGRAQLVGIATRLSNHIRGLVKTFGRVVPKGGGRIFAANVKTLLDGQEVLAAILLPLLETWRAVRMQAAGLERQLMAAARASAHCRLIMTTPGIGALTALSYASMIENPGYFKNARSVGAYAGLTVRGAIIRESGLSTYETPMRAEYFIVCTDLRKMAAMQAMNSCRRERRQSHVFLSPDIRVRSTMTATS